MRHYPNWELSQCEVLSFIHNTHFKLTLTNCKTKLIWQSRKICLKTMGPILKETGNSKHSEGIFLPCFQLQVFFSRSVRIVMLLMCLQESVTHFPEFHQWLPVFKLPVCEVTLEFVACCRTLQYIWQFLSPSLDILWWDIPFFCTAQTSRHSNKLIILCDSAFINLGALKCNPHNNNCWKSKWNFLRIILELEHCGSFLRQFWIYWKITWQT